MTVVLKFGKFPLPDKTKNLTGEETFFSGVISVIRQILQAEKARFWKQKQVFFAPLYRGDFALR